MPGRVIGIEWIRLVGPVGEDGDEFAAFQPAAEAQLETLEYALSFQAGLDGRRWVIRRHSSPNVDLEFVAVPAEAPGEGQTGSRIAKEDRLMIDKFMRRRRQSAAGEIGRRCASDYPGLQYLACHQGGAFRRTEAHRHIHARHHLLAVIADDQVERE